MVKFTWIFLCAFIVFGLITGISQRFALACEFISYTRYTEVSPNVYLSPSFEQTKQEELLTLIHSGKSRVNQTFGEMTSFPRVIIAETAEQAASFGSNAYGNALLSPLGECIVLGPKGHNIDVIAHEFTHAEVHYRVGWLNHFLHVPIWFNEGIALLVDHRAPYLPENIQLLPSEITAIKDNDSTFFTGPNVLKNYQAARLAVAEVEPAKLYQNLEKLRQGQAIARVFNL